MNARLKRITVYPIKSLDGQEVESSLILAGGALNHDREYALFDKEGRFINGKNNAKVHCLRAGFDLGRGLAALGVQGSGSAAVFNMESERSEMEEWLKSYFGMTVSLRRNIKRGFPDDTEAPGPTLVSTATLKAVASWFHGMTLGELRRRFRANLEISGVPAFWEDRLVKQAGNAVRFSIGEVVLEGLKVCARCVVPTRHPDTGEALPDFAKHFAEKRRRTLPAWAEPTRFDHAYRLTVNTRIPGHEAGKELKAGDVVTIC